MIKTTKLNFITEMSCEIFELTTSHFLKVKKKGKKIADAELYLLDDDFLFFKSVEKYVINKKLL